MSLQNNRSGVILKFIKFTEEEFEINIILLRRKKQYFKLLWKENFQTTVFRQYISIQELECN